MEEGLFYKWEEMGLTAIWEQTLRLVGADARTGGRDGAYNTFSKVH